MAHSGQDMQWSGEHPAFRASSTRVSPRPHCSVRTCVPEVGGAHRVAHVRDVRSRHTLAVVHKPARLPGRDIWPVGNPDWGVASTRVSACQLVSINVFQKVAVLRE